MLYKDQDIETAVLYEVFEAVELQLTSLESDEVDPVKVDYEMKEFDGKLAKLQMDTEKLKREKVDTRKYDGLEVTFNDAAGAFKSADGKGIKFGEKIQIKIQPIGDKDTESAMNAIGNLWLSLIWIAVCISLFLAIF